jgi:predicted amidohydrolase YtcJ
MQFWPKDQVLDKFTALQLYTSGSAWFSGEEKDKGKLVKGMYADLAILSDDYFSLKPDDIRKIESVLTVVNGKVVYASEAYKDLNPEIPAVIPDWSPVKYFGGYQR